MKIPYCSKIIHFLVIVKLLNLLFQAILSHPKVIVFMTHCGMHGVMEAIYHGVPMVGMPVFIDQVGFHS
jgi:UDP:flavonoid glycosyltransferase YjiC (YdhE family)